MKPNRHRDLDPQPPIYVILLDLHDFYFYSYDGTKFQRMVEITIPPHAQFMEGMAQGVFPCCLIIMLPASY